MRREEGRFLLGSCCLGQGDGDPCGFRTRARSLQGNSLDWNKVGGRTVSRGTVGLRFRYKFLPFMFPKKSYIVSLERSLVLF